MTRMMSGLALCLGALLAWIMLAGRVPAEAQTQFVKGQPVSSAPSQALLSCLSYAPYRRSGDAPWHADRPIRPEQIRQDLILLRPLTGCVRTYGVEHGLEAVPAIARELGFKVKLGVWIGGDDEGNERHLERAIGLAREYRDVVDLLIVGNEVLLRGEQSPQGMVRLLDKARAANVVPVAYADVWEFWQRHGEVLRGHVDVVAVHVLPYWEDEPIGVERAVDHVQAVLGTMTKTFAPLPVWLAETGWPAAGRQRGPAVPGLQEQTRFMRDWLKVAPQEYNLIEAFDQPWKRDLEGAMGGHWGILDAQGQHKISWQGPLPANIRSIRLIGGMLAGALLGALMGGLQSAWMGRLPGGLRGSRMEAIHRDRVASPIGCIAAGLLAGASLGPLAILQFEMIMLWGRSATELAAGSIYALIGLLATMFALRFMLTGQGRGLLRGSVILLLGMTVAQALALVLDGRYRPLVWPILIAPAMSLLLLGASGSAPGASKLSRHTIGLLLLATLLVTCAVALIVIEGLQNTQALQAGLTWALLAMGSVLALRASGHDADHATSPSGA